MFDRVFYIDETHQVFECFRDKQPELFSGNLQREMSESRNKGLNLAVINRDGIKFYGIDQVSKQMLFVLTNVLMAGGSII